MLSDDYPLVYKRGKHLIMINTSQKTFTKRIGGHKVITENNCEFTEYKITLKSESFAILADRGVKL